MVTQRGGGPDLTEQFLEECRVSEQREDKDGGGGQGLGPCVHATRQGERGSGRRGWGIQAVNSLS